MNSLYCLLSEMCKESISMHVQMAQRHGKDLKIWGYSQTQGEFKILMNFNGEVFFFAMKIEIQL